MTARPITDERLGEIRQRAAYSVVLDGEVLRDTGRLMSMLRETVEEIDRLRESLPEGIAS